MKKAQFYIFTAIIFISIAAMIYSNKSRFDTDKLADLKEYMGNYDYEAGIVMNNAARNNNNISLALSNYTQSFISYASSRDLDLGILYLYSYDGNIHIVNYLNEPVSITTIGITLNHSLETETSFTGKISIIYRNETYNYYFFDPFENEIKTLFIVEK
jgi:hypothetical protein